MNKFIQVELREKVLVGLNLFSMGIDTEGYTPELLEAFTNRIMEDFSTAIEKAVKDRDEPLSREILALREDLEKAVASERQRCVEAGEKRYRYTIETLEAQNKRLLEMLQLKHLSEPIVFQVSDQAKHNLEQMK